MDAGFSGVVGWLKVNINVSMLYFFPLAYCSLIFPCCFRWI